MLSRGSQRKGKKRHSLDTKEHFKLKKLKSQPAESEQQDQDEGSAKSGDSVTSAPLSNSVFVSSLSGSTYVKPKKQTSNARKQMVSILSESCLSMH